MVNGFLSLVGVRSITGVFFLLHITLLFLPGFYPRYFFIFFFYFFWRCEYYGVRHYLAVFSLLFLFWGVPFVRVGMGYII